MKKYTEEPKRFQNESEEYAAYRQAVWDYMVEHSDIVRGGRLFVKFHSSGRDDLESHIRARMLYNYHRGDPKGKEAEMQRRKDKVAEVSLRNQKLSEARKLENPLITIGKYGEEFTLRNDYKLPKFINFITPFGENWFTNLIKKIFHGN